MTTHTRSTRSLALAGLAAGALLAVGAPLAASAHVGVTPDDTAAGAYSLLTFSVGHGCDGAATTRIAIDIPESIVSVTPTVNPNWTIEKVKTGEGDAARTSQIVYTAITPLEDGLRDTFVLSAKLPADAAGDTLEFPVLQSCTVGETNWNEPTVAGEAEPDAPAPAFTLTEASAEGDGHGGHGAVAPAEETSTAAGESSVAPAAPSADIIARVLGAVGLVVGAVGITLAVATRRSAAAK